MRKLIQKQPSFYFKNTCAELSKTVFPGIVITGSRGGEGGLEIPRTLIIAMPTTMKSNIYSKYISYFGKAVRGATGCCIVKLLIHLCC